MDTIIEEFIEIRKAVDNINDDIFEQTEELEEAIYLTVGYFTYGMFIIKFMGDVIWSSDDDDREYFDEEKDILEPLEGYLRRRIMEKIITASDIRI